MAGIEFLKNLPKNTGVQVGVLDVRSNAIESPETIAKRIRKVTAHVPAEKVTLSTDCGMKPLARMVAKMKLKALAEGGSDRPKRTQVSPGRLGESRTHRPARGR